MAMAMVVALFVHARRSRAVPSFRLLVTLSAAPLNTNMYPNIWRGLFFDLVAEQLPSYWVEKTQEGIRLTAQDVSRILSCGLHMYNVIDNIFVNMLMIINNIMTTIIPEDEHTQMEALLALTSVMLVLTMVAYYRSPKNPGKRSPRNRVRITWSSMFQDDDDDDEDPGILRILMKRILNWPKKPAKTFGRKRHSRRLIILSLIIVTMLNLGTATVANRDGAATTQCNTTAQLHPRTKRYPRSCALHDAH